MKHNILILIYLMITSQGISGQNPFPGLAGIDSLVQRHKILTHRYDSLLGTAADTVSADRQEWLPALLLLANTDRQIIDRDWPLMRRACDSLVRVYQLREAELQQQANRLVRLNNTLMVAWVLSGGFLLLFLVFLLAWWRRGSLARKNAEQAQQSEKLILEYRKRLNELQSALDNCRSQAKMIVTENSRIDRENQQLAADIRKARDAGWLSQAGEPSLPEKLKEAEQRLAEELTKKKVLEAELVQLLSRLRGEE